MTQAIEAVHLTKRYGRTTAVDDLTFSVPAGSVTGFIGPNGAGKSTTMQMILGLARPDGGRALVNGRRYSELRRPLQEAGARLPQARNELTVRLGRTPRDGELAAELDIDPDDLAYLEGARAVQSFPDPDLLLVRSAALSDERMQLAAAFRALAPAEQEVLYLRYVRDLGRTEAADRLGISEGQLSRRTQAALGKLRTQIESVGSTRATPPSAAHGRSEGDAVSAPQLERSGKARPRAGRSGRLVLRMPPSLHAELANAAERDSLSLNQFITNALSAAVEGREAEAREGRPRLESRTVGRRWLRAAFIANVVAVVAVGVLAVILVVAGWDGAW